MCDSSNTRQFVLGSELDIAATHPEPQTVAHDFQSRTKRQKLSMHEYAARFDECIEGYPQSASQGSDLSRNLQSSHYVTPPGSIFAWYNMPQTVKPVTIDSDLDSDSPEDVPLFSKSTIHRAIKELRAYFDETSSDGGYLEARNASPITAPDSQPPQFRKFKGLKVEASVTGATGNISAEPILTLRAEAASPINEPAPFIPASLPNIAHTTQGLHVKAPVLDHILGDPDSPTFRLQHPGIKADRMPKKRKFDLAMYGSDDDDLSGCVDPIGIPPRPQFEKCRKIATNKRIERAAKNKASGSNLVSTSKITQPGLNTVKTVLNLTDEEDSLPPPPLHDGHARRLRDSGSIEGLQVIPGKLALDRQKKKLLKQVPVHAGNEQRRGIRAASRNCKNKKKGDKAKTNKSNAPEGH